MGLHLFHPAMTKQLTLFHPHPVGKLQHLSCSLVVVFHVASQLAHIGHCRYAHKHIIEPHRVLLWAKSGEGAIAESVFLVEDIINITVDEWSQSRCFRRVLQHSLNHRTADGAGIIQRMRINDTAYIAVDSFVFLKDFLKNRCYISQQLMPLGDIVAIRFIAGSFISGQHTAIGDAPLIAGQSESALLQLGIGIDVFQVVHLFPCFLIDEDGRCLCINVLQNPVH